MMTNFRFFETAMQVIDKKTHHRSISAPPVGGALIVLVLVALACSLDTANPGVIANAEADTRFVGEPSQLIFHSPQGIERVRLDGGDRKMLFPDPGLHVEDVSSDWSMFLLGNPDTELMIGDLSSGNLRKVVQLDRRAGDAVFSPDGNTIAATWHADFSKPQAEWKDDDTIFLIDVDTLAIKILPPSRTEQPLSIRWSADGFYLWAIMPPEVGVGQWISPADGKRQEMKDPLGPLHSPFVEPDCPGKLEIIDEGTAIRLTDETGDRILVSEEGRQRGLHDYLDDFRHVSFTPSCSAVIFDRFGEIWVVEIESGRAGVLVEGDWLFFIPRELVH
jgi:hypothetical protein